MQRKKSNQKLERKKSLKKQFGKVSRPTTNLFKQQHGFHASQHYFHVLIPFSLHLLLRKYFHLSEDKRRSVRSSHEPKLMIRYVPVNKISLQAQ